MQDNQSYLSHLSELKQRIFKILIFFFIFFAISYFLSSKIYYFLAIPYIDAIGGKAEFIYTNLTEVFFVKLELAYKSSFLITMPYIAFNIYKFLEPGLYKIEKKFLKYVLIAIPFLFLSGMFFVYFLVMPKAFAFFISFQENSPEINLTLTAKINEYINLVTSLIVAFGIAFQLPIFILLLVSLNFLSSENLQNGRRYAVVLIFIIAGVITPPDVISQIFLAIALLILYEITVYLSKKLETWRQRA